MSAISISDNRKARLKKLARLMNRKNEMMVPPMTPVLELLDYDIEDGEIDFLIELGTAPRTIEDIAALCGSGIGEARAVVDQFVKRGFLWTEPGVPNSEKYELTPIVVGWLELQLLGDLDPEKSMEFARRLSNLFAEVKKLNFFPMRNISNLLTPKITKPCQSIGAIPGKGGNGDGITIPVNRKVESGASTVFPIQDAYELVDRHGANNQVGLLPCFCRRWRRMTDDPCRFDIPNESCIVVGPGAEHICDHGFGRRIEKNDALKVLEEVAKAGAIHTLFHERDDIRRPNVAVCNCCWDCCGIYGSYNRAAIPMYFKSTFIARVSDPEACKSCEKCVKHCPTNAIAVVDGAPLLNKSICIGCGQCALQCPVNVFSLEPMERDVLVPLLKPSKARL